MPGRIAGGDVVLWESVVQDKKTAMFHAIKHDSLECVTFLHRVCNATCPTIIRPSGAYDVRRHSLT